MSPILGVRADRRFRRAHVKPARRRQGWRALVKPLVRAGLPTIVVASLLYRGAAVVTETRVLTIDRVVVSGNERLSRGDVMAVLSGLRGESLLFTDLTAWRQRLLASPWVRDAALRRSLPSTVEVDVIERQPMGICRLNGELYLVDEGGVIIDQYGPPYANFDLPVIDGLAAKGGTSGTDTKAFSAPGGSVPETMTGGARAELATRVIAALKPRPVIARRLSQVDVSDPHNATVILSGDPAVLELGEDQFLARIESYLDLAPALHARVADIDYVDLRFDDRIYVRPAGRPGRDGRAKEGPHTTAKERRPSGLQPESSRRPF